MSTFGTSVCCLVLAKHIHHLFLHRRHWDIDNLHHELLQQVIQDDTLFLNPSRHRRRRLFSHLQSWDIEGRLLDVGLNVPVDGTLRPKVLDWTWPLSGDQRFIVHHRKVLCASRLWRKRSQNLDVSCARRDGAQLSSTALGARLWRQSARHTLNWSSGRLQHL